MEWAAKILLSIKDKKDSENECIYSVIHKKNKRSILIRCKECNGRSSLNDETCRRNILRILLEEPVVDRIVLSHLYERDYEGSSLEMLYLLAHFQKSVNTYTESLTEYRKLCDQEQCQIKKIIESIADTAKKDPLKAYGIIIGADNGNIEIDPHCMGCARILERIIEDVTKSASGLERFDQKNTEDFDYDRIVSSHVRPSFSTSRIYTEPPGNTLFLECYDIQHKREGKLEVSIYKLTDRPEKLYFIAPIEYNLKPPELKMIERVRKKIIRHKPNDLNFTDPAASREYFRRIGEQMLIDDCRSHGIHLEPSKIDIYSDILAKYTTGLGILEDILSDERISDVYINAPADINPVHVVMEGEECITNIFLSQDDLDSMVSRFRTISGRPFGEATPVLEMELKEYGVRVSVIGDPLSNNGLAYAFRKHAPTPWTLPKLINTGSISPLAAGLLSFVMEGQSSMLVAGDVGAGKTSLLCAMLIEIPQKYRILTIEDTREIPIEQLQKLGWKMQGMISRSSILGSEAEVSPEVALRAALRLGNSSLVIGEVRGPEVAVLYEAMQIGTAGNCVIGTIHGASTRAVYERIVHTLGVPVASFRSTDAVVVCANTKLGAGLTKTKRVIQIAEINTTLDESTSPENVFSEILKFDASKDCLVATDILDRGQSELIAKIAMKMGISIDEASRNIQMRGRIKEKIARVGKSNPEFLEADFVSAANNMFWMLMDSEKNKTSKVDYQEIYDRWCEWFENISHQHKEMYRGNLSAARN